MKLKKFFSSNTKTIYLKLLIVYESKLKIKVTSPWTFLQILITLIVICKQRLLDENENVQYLHNYKCYGIDQNCFRKTLESPEK